MQAKLENFECITTETFSKSSAYHIDSLLTSRVLFSLQFSNNAHCYELGHFYNLLITPQGNLFLGVSK